MTYKPPCILIVSNNKATADTLRAMVVEDCDCPDDVIVETQRAGRTAWDFIRPQEEPYDLIILDKTSLSGDFDLEANIRGDARHRNTKVVGIGHDEIAQAIHEICGENEPQTQSANMNAENSGTLPPERT